MGSFRFGSFSVMYGFLQLLPAIAQAIVELIQPVLVPLCFVLAWTMMGMMIWGIWTAVRDSFQRAHRMHQIPCAQCRYFSGDYLLKCPVHPREALSEAAISCPDFESSGFNWQISRSSARGS